MKKRNSHLADIDDRKDGSEEIASLLTPGSSHAPAKRSAVDANRGEGLNPLGEQNPVIEDHGSGFEERGVEHRMMPATPRWKGPGQNDKTVR